MGTNRNGRDGVVGRVNFCDFLLVITLRNSDLLMYLSHAEFLSQQTGEQLSIIISTSSNNYSVVLTNVQ